MLGLSLALSPGNPILNRSGTTTVPATVLERQPDGTVTVIALGTVWTAHLTREGDGTVTVSQ